MELSIQEIAAKALPSVVEIVVSDEHSIPLALGTGFFVSPTVVATNAHVIAGAASATVSPVSGGGRFPANGVLDVDETHDLALIQVPQPGRPLELDDEGIISAVRQVGGYQLFQMTAPISPGSSGGPVLDQHGKVVGIAVASIIGGQNLNFVVPSQYLRADLEDANNKPIPFKKISVVDESYIAKAYGAKHPVDKVVAGQFRWKSGVIATGDFSLTVKNELAVPITNVQVLVVFMDNSGQPIDTTVVRFPKYSFESGSIPPGLAKRLTGNVDSSTQELTSRPSPSNQFELDTVPATPIRFRTLDFEASADSRTLGH